MQQQLTETMDRMTRERQESETRLQMAIDDAKKKWAAGGIFDVIGRVLSKAVPFLNGPKKTPSPASSSKPGAKK